MRFRKSWTEQFLHSELLPVCAGLGRFPARSDLESLGRGDIGNALARYGGYEHWAKKMGFERRHSDSDTGWDGEKECQKILINLGYKCDRPSGVRNPYDLIVDDYTRIDVKTANYAEYGVCSGWFYRIGKHQSADLVMLFQSDTKEFYMIPWFLCPTTNITIARDGGKYNQFKNNLEVLRQFTGVRATENKIWAKAIAPINRRPYRDLK